MDINHKRLIFLVDDDEFYLDGFIHHLNTIFGEKIEIKFFHDGESCLKELHLSPAIIFLDYFLDKVDTEAMNGYETLKKIREEKPDVPVVMLSSQKRFGVAAQTILKGAHEYIIKGDDAFDKADDLIKQMLKRNN